MSQSYYGRHDSSPGAMLAAAREELNLSVSEVARHLKLSPAQVEALEEGAYDRLPGRVFVRGFLRNYAKLLGIDPQPLLRTIEHEMPQAAPVDEAPPSTEVVMPRERTTPWAAYLGFGAFVVVGVLAIYEFGFNEAPGDAKPAAKETAAAEPTGHDAGAPASPAAAPQTGGPAATPAVPSPMAAVPAAAAGTPAAGAPPAVATPARAQGELIAAAGASSTDKAGPPGSRTLQMKFDTESWVEVRDRNNKVIFSKLNKAGGEETVNGMPPFKLVVGNARGVHLNYGEKAVDLTPHIGVTVARLTLE
jgi:cytoskeleton protein RodZ